MKKKIRIQKCLVLYVIATIFLCFSSCLAQDVIKIEGGNVKGIVEDGITIYKGIPFAAPPIGDLRWKAPQPVVPWDGVLIADEFGPACPQMVYPNSASIDNSVGIQSEDCLYLNIWTPTRSGNEKLPVMVWIYGGGFAIGGTSITNYSGENLAKKGIILVSMAYRVGALGFLAHPELSAENQHGVSGNYGLLDQIAGLKWGKKQYCRFWGRPGECNNFGESAGGVSVSMLCGSPLAKGLFQRAISQSGGAFGPVGNYGNAGIAPLKSAEKQGSDFARRMRVVSIDELRELPAEKLLQDSLANMGGFWPICDGYTIVDDQYKRYSEGKYNDVDVLIGTNSNEGAMFVNDVNVEMHKASVKTTFGLMAEKALEVYPATDDSVATQSARNIFRDRVFAWPTWTWAKLQTKTGNSNVYLYYFDQPQPPRLEGHTIVGAEHSDEINYVFGHVDKNFNFQYRDEDRVLSSIIMNYWVNFARTGNPNGEGLPEWTQFNDDSNDAVMFLKDPLPFLGTVPNRPQLQFMEKYFRGLRESK